LFTKNQEIKVAEKPKTFQEAVIATKPKYEAPTSAQIIDTKDILAKLEARTGVKLSVNAQSIASGDTLFDSLTGAQKTVINNTMAKLGYKSQNIKELKANLEAYYPELYNAAKSFADLNAKLLADYLPGEGTTPARPTRSITMIDRAQFDATATDIYLKKAGFRPTAEQLKADYDEVVKMNTGTLTEYKKKVYNPKTKKYENQQITTPGLTDDAIAARLEEKIKKQNPQAVENTSQQSFYNFILNADSMRGGR
jgi:hypothetical protein